MIKKAIAIIVLILVILAGFVYLGLFLLGRFLFPYGHELEVEIHNNSNVELVEFYLTYRDLKEDILVDDTSIGGSTTLRIDAVDNVDESPLVLYYYDNSSVKQEIVVIGYFEGSGGGQKSIVYINSVDENGIFDIEVEIVRP